MVSLITTEELQKLISKGMGYLLLDVREKNELVHGMIPTAKNLPVTEIEHAEKMSAADFRQKYGFKKFTKEDIIITYCRLGRRSGRAAEFLQKKGYQVRSYKGSVNEWSKIDSKVQMYGLH